MVPLPSEHVDHVLNDQRASFDIVTDPCSVLDNDTLTIEINKKQHRVEFLIAGFKAHAVAECRIRSA